MAFLAGERITAARLNRLKPAVYSATGSSNLALTTTDTDISGATVTFTTDTDGATYSVIAVFSYDITSATTASTLGVCQLDGTPLSGQSRWSGEVGTDFGMAPQQWTGSVGTAGSHTFKLSASMSLGTGITVLAAFTKLIVTIQEDV